MTFDAGPFCTALALVAGILAGEHAAEQAGGGGGAMALLVGSAAGGASLLVVRRPRVALAMIGFALLGCGSMQRALDGLQHSRIAVLRDEGASVVVRGTVADDPDGPRFSTALLVRVSTVAPAGEPAR